MMAGDVMGYSSVRCVPRPTCVDKRNANVYMEDTFPWTSFFREDNLTFSM